jgi:hypothetical protein
MNNLEAEKIALQVVKQAATVAEAVSAAESLLSMADTEAESEILASVDSSNNREELKALCRNT